MLVQGLAKTDFSMREWGILVYLEQHGQATASELSEQVETLSQQLTKIN